MKHNIYFRSIASAALLGILLDCNNILATPDAPVTITVSGHDGHIVLLNAEIETYRLERQCYLHKNRRR